MENRKYVISRDDVYVGSVVLAHNIYRRDADVFLGTKAGKLDTSCWMPYRSMLFVPNEDQLSNDLLYNSPSYPILNVTADDICLNLGKDSVVVKGVCSLGPLLEYFGYNKELTYADIMRARETFFTGRFAKDNCELFGWKEAKPEDWTYYEEGIQVTDPRRLKRIIAREERARKRGHRSFMGVSESILPKEYWDVLDDLGDNSLWDILGGWETKFDAFVPHKNEGPVKKLTKF